MARIYLPEGEILKTVKNSKNLFSISTIEEALKTGEILEAKM